MFLLKARVRDEHQRVRIGVDAVCVNSACSFVGEPLHMPTHNTKSKGGDGIWNSSKTSFYNARLMRLIILLSVITFLTFCSRKKDDVNIKNIAGINIPENIEPAEIRNEILPNGDGYLVHRYSISVKMYEDFENQLRTLGVSELPFSDTIFVDNLIFEFVNENDEGLYRIINDEEDPRDILLTVLDKSKMELIIMLSKQ